MTVYKILDSEITVSTAIENSRYIANVFYPYFSTCEETIKKWYRQQGDCSRILRNYKDLQVQIVLDFLEEAFGILNSNQIYTIDKESLAIRFLSNCLEELNGTAEDMALDLDDIDENKENAAEFRRMRKASRDRWHGGGFGISGAITGAAKAGALNAASGIGHSIRNAAGNFVSSVGASVKKGQLFSQYEPKFVECAENIIFNVESEMREILKAEKNLKFEFQSEEDNQKGNAIYQNFANGNIPSSSRREMIATALSLNYYNPRIYETIWYNYGDPTGDLIKMANAFDISLASYINHCIDEYGKKACQTHCPNFVNSKNKINASLRYEQDIKNTISHIQTFCKEHDVPYSKSSMLGSLNKYLETADKLKKTVEGEYYNTEAEANNVRHDIDEFNRILEVKSIYDEDAFDVLSTGEYLSQKFVSDLRKRFVCEKILRNPHDITETLFALTVKGNKNKTTSGAFGIIGKCGNIEETRQTIEEICILQPEETILAIIDRSIGIFNNKGKGKSGILFTNMNLRIFSKLLLAKENETFDLNSIQNIEALGENEYLLSLKSGRTYKFEINLGDFSIEEQNFLAELILRCVDLIRHIYVDERIQLKKILNPEGVKCVCGKYILKSEKICSSCHRFVDANGVFTESMECPNCRGYVKINSRFCTKCGYEILPTPDPEPADIIEQENSEVKEEPTAAKDESMSCPTCGKENPVGKKFCKHCGGKLVNEEKSSAVKLCPNCGNEIKPGKAFCGKCGSKI